MKGGWWKRWASLSGQSQSMNVEETEARAVGGEGADGVPSIDERVPLSLDRTEEGGPGSGPKDKRFTDLIGVLIVVATLAAAIVGYLLSAASKASDAAAVAAQQFGIDASSSLLQSQARAQAQYETFLTAQEERRQAANAFQAWLFATGPDATRLGLEVDRWKALAAETQKLTPISPDSPDGPNKDPFFPRRFFSHATTEGVRRSALQDATNEENSAWLGRTTSYTAVLTMLAVALYLLGFSLSLTIGIKRLFTIVGVLLLFIGSLWTMVVALAPPHRANQEAATEFALGLVGTETAADAAEYREAIRHLTRAIELRPNFARAYFVRSEATSAAGSPQGRGFLSITTPQALAASAADLVKAKELGLDNLTVRLDLGFDEYLLGLQHHDPSQIARGIADTRQAMMLAPRGHSDVPVLRYNLGDALLASGRGPEARAAFADAVRWTIYSDPAKKTLRNYPGLEEELVAGALTDLDNLAHVRPALASQVKDLKEFIVGSVSRGDGTLGAKPSSVTATGARVDVFPKELQVSGLRLDGYDPVKSKVSVQWYYQDPSKLGWGVVSSVSGGGLTPNSEVPGTYFNNEPHLRSNGQCTRNGQYRVEIYVDGNLVTSAEGAAKFGQLSPVINRDLNLAVCRSPDWTRAPISTDYPGLVDGYVSPDRKRGMYLFRLNDPALRGADPYEVSTSLTSLLVTAFPDLFPSAPALRSTLDNPHEAFLRLDGPTRRWYDYTGGEVLAKAGVAKDGGVIVGMIFGPTSYFDNGREPYELFDSMTIYDTTGVF